MHCQPPQARDKPPPDTGLSMTLFIKPCLTLATLLAILSAGGCGCGFDCNRDDDNDNDPASLTLGLSDEAVEELKQVVLTIDSITFVRSAADDVVIDTFTIPDLDLEESDTFTLDLLDYRGRNQLEVIQALSMEVGSYSSIVLSILDEDINFSYVQQSDDSLVAITVAASQGLSLPGMRLDSGEESHTIEFSLAQSLRYRSSSDDYLLSDTGIRVEDNAVAASLSGRVDASLFNTVSPCDEKLDPVAGNRIYLYSGTGLGSADLADVFTSASATTVPDNVQAPFAVATMAANTLTGNWEYVFGFLPAGDYTLALACNAEDDDAVDYDDISVPLPVGQRYEITLSEAELATCDMAVDANCS
jgi:hypothetical protein